MTNPGVLPLSSDESDTDAGMPTLRIRFHKRDTMLQQLEHQAQSLDLTVEQLAKRYICEGLDKTDDDNAPALPGTSLEDFLTNNSVITPESNSDE
jgi:hypothetical protein